MFGANPAGFEGSVFGANKTNAPLSHTQTHTRIMNAALHVVWERWNQLDAEYNRIYAIDRIFDLLMALSITWQAEPERAAVLSRLLAVTAYYGDAKAQSSGFLKSRLYYADALYEVGDVGVVLRVTEEALLPFFVRRRVRCKATEGLVRLHRMALRKWEGSLRAAWLTACVNHV